MSFLPTPEGCHLAMNRDEQRSRPLALPPARHLVGGRPAILPREPGGGTWIAADDIGRVIALINWYAQPHRPSALCRSRGDIIPALLGAGQGGDVSGPLHGMDLTATNPFRLVVVDPTARTLAEWRWTGAALTAYPHEWEPTFWFSSGLDEPAANEVRSAVVAAHPPTNLDDLRALHRSHAPARGALSVCMHRADAMTVSYTEVTVSHAEVRMAHAPGAPCAAPLAEPISLPRASKATAGEAA